MTIATAQSPVDYTNRIQNPSFESNGTAGWTVHGMQTQNNTVFSRKAGTYYLEAWVSIGQQLGNVGVSQVLTKLPRGNYRLTASALHIQQNGSGSTLNRGSSQTGANLYAGLTKVAVNMMKSYTLDYLCSSPLRGGWEGSARRKSSSFIEVKGARANNLKGIDVRFPLGVMTCVTGVSGSGKSSLVRDIFYNAMKRHLDEVADRPGEFLGLEGDLNMVSAVEFIDQNPIGKSTRSNPVTYVKAWDEIRKLFASLPLAQQMGYTPAYFSFNTDGGRCEECKGEGTVTIEMQFMADLVLPCESCHGQRFKSEILDVRFHEKNVCDVLDMTVNQAIEFFTEHKQKRIIALLKPLQDVGLGYIKLGQSSSTLSGGENQRVKLAYYLGMEKTKPTIFIFDEPTTGLHFHDIRKLLLSFDALIHRGHTIIVIEHNLEVIKNADHIIDLGPEGGEAGGRLVCCGTPEEVAKCKESYTAKFLREKMNESKGKKK